MVKIVHEHNGQRVEGESAGLGDGMFLLVNKKGGFCSLCPGVNVTKYNGLVQYDAERGEHVKTLENVNLAKGAITAVTNRISSVSRVYDHGAVETFRYGSTALHYLLENYAGELFLDLDVRRLYDDDAHGRVYRVTHEEDRLVIEYKKYADDSCRDLAYQQFVVIKGVTDYRPVDAWQRREYQYDGRRGEHPEKWVFRPGAIIVDGTLALVVARSKLLEKALEKASYAWEHADEIWASQDAYAKNAYKEAGIEANLALAALDSLVTKQKGQSYAGIYAGLPWFSRYWSRDELISLGGVIAAGHYSLAKEVLLRYYALADKQPALDAYYPSGGLLAADALGWLAKRTADLVRTLRQKDLLQMYFTKKELGELRNRLERVVKLLLAQRSTPEGLIVNGPGETWMDAAYAGDHRGGVRIEIQALQYAMYDALALLDQQTRLFSRGQWWRKAAFKLAASAKEKLYLDGVLADGMRDDVLDARQRPNVFLAYYIAPHLFSKDEWRAAFDHALERLWLSWGGLSTIDIADALYTPRHTGINDQSYHRGDSWYWVNAASAIALRTLDGERYAEKIRALRAACVSDLLWQGALGHCSEVSSAESQEWGGTFAQAWSAGMLYELLKES